MQVERTVVVEPAQDRVFPGQASCEAGQGIFADLSLEFCPWTNRDRIGPRGTVAARYAGGIAWGCRLQ